MNGSRTLAIMALVGAVVLGRQLLPQTADPTDEEPVAPVSRVVDDVSFDDDWTLDPEVRDPFMPLVLPDPLPLIDIDLEGQ